MKVLYLGCSKPLVKFLASSRFLVLSESDPDVHLESLEDVPGWIQCGVDAVFVDLDQAKHQHAVSRLRQNGVSVPIIGFAQHHGASKDWALRLEAFLKQGGDALFEHAAIVNKNQRVGVIDQLRAIERRYHGQSQNTVEFPCDGADISVDLTTHAVAVNGSRVKLGVVEERMVRFLALRRDKVQTYRAIEGHLYRTPASVPKTATNLAVHLSFIRKKLAKHHPDAPKVFKAIYGEGLIMTALPIRGTRIRRVA